MSYAHHRFILMTVDPTHIGAGGYRLGRVDNSIIREPGTDLPKIPGTSLSGAVRSYAAYRYDKIRCAGQGQERTSEGRPVPDSSHCGRAACPICYTFGFTVGEKSYAGTVNLFDAHILLFPVHSMIGPVWVSTKGRLEEFGFTAEGDEPVEAPGGESFVTTAPRTEPLNLGWLMLPVTGRAVVSPPTDNCDWGSQRAWEGVRERIVLAPQSLFSQIVNANLEVRTSVSIDPQTGAAQSGALFTFEAIPRAAFLAFDLVQDDYRDGAKPWSDGAPVARTYASGHENAGHPLYPDPADGGSPINENGRPKGWTMPWEVVQSGLEWASVLGVGGMGTRGFGRFALVGSRWEVING
jgi:CRISPR-associated protein Cmr4